MFNALTAVWAIWPLVAVAGLRDWPAIQDKSGIRKDEVSQGLPYLNSTNWLAGIVGSAIAGYVVDGLGMASLFLFAAWLSLAAAVLLMLLSSGSKVFSLGSLSLTQTN